MGPEMGAGAPEMSGSAMGPGGMAALRNQYGIENPVEDSEGYADEDLMGTESLYEHQNIEDYGSDEDLMGFDPSAIMSEDMMGMGGGMGMGGDMGAMAPEDPMAMDEEDELGMMGAQMSKVKGSGEQSDALRHLLQVYQEDRKSRSQNFQDKARSLNRQNGL